MGEGLKRAFAAAKATRKPCLPVPTEHQEQVAVIDWCSALAWRYPELARVYAIPNAGGYSGGFKRNVVRVQKMLKEGVRPGYPDLGLDVARGGYHGLRIEMKRMKGSHTSEAQRDWRLWLTDQGYYVVVCEGAEAAQGALLWYLAGAR